jgi:heavy metal sensor kinase
MRILSLKWRIGIYTALVLLLAISIISVIAYWNFKKAIFDSLDYQLETDTDTIRNMIQEEGSLEDARNHIAAIFAPESNLHRWGYKIWFEGEDELFSSNENIDLLLEKVVQKNNSIQWKEGVFTTDTVYNEKPLRVIWAKYTVLLNGESSTKALNVVGSINADHVKHETAKFLATLLIITAIVIWAGIGGLSWALRWGLRPLKQMTMQMESISERPPIEADIDCPETIDELRPFVTSWRRMLGRLSLAMEENRRFTSDASHELRTPLAIVKSTLQLARSQKRSPEFYEQSIDQSLEDLDRMNKLIDKLLELSRIDKLFSLKTQKQIDMKYLAERIIAKYEPIASDKGKVLQAKLCHSQVKGDGIHLERMLANLLDNAILYSPDKSAISVSMKKENTQLRFIVHDEGGKITPVEQTKIFERFYRIDQARDRKTGGTGLGLAIAKEIALEHGGDITVASSCDKGTDFIINLPLS